MTAALSPPKEVCVRGVVTQQTPAAAVRSQKGEFEVASLRLRDSSGGVRVSLFGAAAHQVQGVAVGSTVEVIGAIARAVKAGRDRVELSATGLRSSSQAVTVDIAVPERAVFQTPLHTTKQVMNPDGSCEGLYVNLMVHVDRISRSLGRTELTVSDHTGTVRVEHTGVGEPLAALSSGQLLLLQDCRVRKSKLLFTYVSHFTVSPQEYPPALLLGQYRTRNPAGPFFAAPPPPPPPLVTRSPSSRPMYFLREVAALTAGRAGGRSHMGLTVVSLTRISRSSSSNKNTDIALRGALTDTSGTLRHVQIIGSAVEQLCNCSSSTLAHMTDDERRCQFDRIMWQRFLIRFVVDVRGQLLVQACGPVDWKAYWSHLLKVEAVK